jgi:transcriptional regulator with XRE-family HTH domain
MARRLGANIAALRKAREWTQSDLAERVGVDTETISASSAVRRFHPC